MHPGYPIARISKLFGKSRQAFHQMETRQTKECINDEILLVYVKEIRKQQPRLGARKMYDMLQDTIQTNAIKIGRDKFFLLLKENDLLVKKRRKHIHTTDSNHVYKRYLNLIKEYIPTGPEQIWVSDITYLSIENDFVYLSLVTDLYSKKIMGYHVNPTLETFGPLEALKMALKNRTHPDSLLIHHSDHGIQYCCHEYINVLEGNQIQISMSARGNPYENATAERVNGILKSEFYLDRCFNNLAEVQFVVKDTVRVYNNLRPHASCDYLTPDQAHNMSGVLKKRWKNYNQDKEPKEIQPISEEVKLVLAQLLKKDSFIEVELP
jgi:putative transposase